MISGPAGNSTRAVAMTPPAGSVLTLRDSWGASAARAGCQQRRDSAQKRNSRPRAWYLPDDCIEQPLVDLPHPFQLSFGGKPLVEPLGAKLFGQCRPWLDDF